MSNNKDRKPLKEKGAHSYNATLKSDKVIYDFRVNPNDPKQQGIVSEKNLLYFVALSYKNSCLKLLEQMRKYDKDKNNYNSLAKYYLPAMFCFRHYIELELKLLYMDWHNEQFLNNHNLKDLLKDLEKNGTCDIGVFKAPLEYLAQLEQINNKPNFEFFRYLIDANFVCKESIEIPMFEFDKIQHFINQIETQTTIMKVNSLSNNK